MKVRALAATALFITAGAAAADVLIIRSTGPSAKSFAPGKRLPDRTPIALKTGDELTVLDAGGTRMLRGPGNILPGNAAGSASASAAGVPRGRSRIAAVRGIPPAGRWDVDVANSRLICVGDAKDVRLWREHYDNPVELVVTRVRDKKSQKIEWPAGEPIVAWPAQFAISDGTEFQLRNASASTTIRFKMLPRKPFEKDDVATAFIAHGCDEQLERFIVAEKATS